MKIIKQKIIENIQKQDLINLIDEKKINVTIPNKKIKAHCCINLLSFKNLDQEKLKKDLLETEEISDIEIVNGYFNLTLSEKFFQNEAVNLENFKFPDLGKQTKINVEYCSVNPTGFLHIGHSRNAILGDAIANLFEKTNFNVVKEYYINDAGNQIDLLAESVFYYYKAENNDKFPENGYKGKEIQELALQIKPGKTKEEIKEIALKYFLDNIKKDLNDLNIHHNSWISEREIIKNEYVAKALKLLSENEYITTDVMDKKQTSKGQESGQKLLLLKTKDAGDDQNRPLTKADGSYTYFANDIGYHLYKIESGAEYIICTLGADHDSYAKRIEIATSMLAKSLNKKIKHQIIKCQLVSFESEGKNLKFSKRMGNSIRCSEFVEEVNYNVLRYIILSKTPGTQFVFDYETSVSASLKNPIFYIQYASARSFSLISNYNEIFKNKTETSITTAAAIKMFQISEFQTLILTMLEFENIIINCVEKIETHSIALYAYKLSEAFHNLWQAGKTDRNKRIIIEDNFSETEDRIKIIKSFRNILKHTLNILGIDALEKM